MSMTVCSRARPLCARRAAARRCVAAARRVVVVDVERAGRHRDDLPRRLRHGVDPVPTHCKQRRLAGRRDVRPVRR